MSKVAQSGVRWPRMLPMDAADLIRASGALPAAALSGAFQALVGPPGAWPTRLTARLCRTQNPGFLAGESEISPFRPGHRIAAFGTLIAW